MNLRRSFASIVAAITYVASTGLAHAAGNATVTVEAHQTLFSPVVPIAAVLAMSLAAAAVAGVIELRKRS